MLLIKLDLIFAFSYLFEGLISFKKLRSSEKILLLFFVVVFFPSFFSRLLQCSTDRKIRIKRTPPQKSSVWVRRHGYFPSLLSNSIFYCIFPPPWSINFSVSQSQSFPSPFTRKSKRKTRKNSFSPESQRREEGRSEMSSLFFPFLSSLFSPETKSYLALSPVERKECKTHKMPIKISLPPCEKKTWEGIEHNLLSRFP